MQPPFSASLYLIWIGITRTALSDILRKSILWCTLKSYLEQIVISVIQQHQKDVNSFYCAVQKI